MVALTLRCEQAIEQLHDALDERLRPEQRSLWLNAHLADCPACCERACGLEHVHMAGSLLSRGLASAPAAAVYGAAHVLWPVAAAVLLAVTLTVMASGRAGSSDSVELVAQRVASLDTLMEQELERMHRMATMVELSHGRTTT